MSKEPKTRAGDYEIGYGRPPKHTRFRKGQSGNPRGRPPTRGAVKIDLNAILNKPVTVIQDGEARHMPPKEVALRKILKKALTKRDLRSIIYLLEQFEKYAAIEFPPVMSGGGVVYVPKTMPMGMGIRLVERFGPQPWSRRQLQIGRAEYLANRTEEEREHDDAVGYADLDEQKQ